MARCGNRLLLAAALLLSAFPARPPGTQRSTPSRTSSSTCGPAGSRRRRSKARPIDITVVVSFNRAGNILGHPRITYESAEASDNDRLQYRVAVMEALQRCTPMPFTDAMAGAAAGRPFAIQFRNRKTSPPTQERRA